MIGLTVFGDGTSSNGEAVLPFRSSLLQAAVEGQWLLTPIYIAYEATGGDASNEVCWWGDAPFAGHFINLLGLEGVKATVVFGEQRQASDDRKVLAEELRVEVLGLKERFEVGELWKRLVSGNLRGVLKCRWFVGCAVINHNPSSLCRAVPRRGKHRGKRGAGEVFLS